MDMYQFLLIKLAEEASEVAQIALKTAQFGPSELCPGLTLTNVARIHEELNDLLGIVSMLNEMASFDFEEGDHLAKKAKVMKYLQYSVDLGQVKL